MSHSCVACIEGEEGEGEGREGGEEGRGEEVLLH